MKANSERIIELFSQALKKDSPEERAEFLAEACRDEPELREQVESFLRAEPAARDFLKPSPAAFLPTQKPGDRIGRYKLLQQIGEGGCGVVYMAEQEEPIRRRVALKVIKLGMDTKQVIARFEAERQVLALMDHPNIAKVFDAGSTETGRPYFVMELVRGVKITDFCDQHHLSTRARLGLFGEICHAIQHAHQKGIIHRDIKPSNVLVNSRDGVPTPKVIDFGIAKATTDQRLTDKTVFTAFEQFIGTPAYMSPEQAEMSALEIDTRSDIYSLGVLLYQLLTGKTPFEGQELLAAGLDEMRRIIREKEPLRPSTRLSTMLQDELTTTAKHQQTEGPKLLHLVRGDLDWIVMKCLEKDRTRRYQTANGVAMDIQRHLNNETITARPPSRLYELRKTLQRHKLGFAAAGGVVVALMIGLSVALVSYYKERIARAGEIRQRKVAQETTRLAQASADAAMAAELKARRFLYAADMNLIQQSLRLNNLGRARELLDRHRPKPGETDLRSWEWRYLWQQCRSGALALLTRRENVRAFSVSVSPDDQWLAVGYYDGQVELWDVASRQRHKVVQEPFDRRAHVAFSPRGGILAATMGSNLVKAYDLTSGATMMLCTVNGYVRDLSFSADGQWLAVLSAEPPSVQVVHAVDARPVMTYPLPVGGGMHFNNVQLSPDKQRLYVSCGAFVNPVVKCVTVPEGRLLWEYDDSRPEGGGGEDWKDTGFSAMALSPDGRQLAVASGYRRTFVRILSTENGRIVKVLRGHAGWICDLAFSRDGHWLASASADQTLRVWDSMTWTPHGDALTGHGQEVHAAAFSQDARFLASGSKDGEVLLWDTQASRPEYGRRHLPAHIIRAFALPIGQAVLGQSKDKTWSLLDLVSFDEQLIPPAEISGQDDIPRIFPTEWRYPSAVPDLSPLDFPGKLKPPVLSPDRKLIAVASESGFVALFDAASTSTVGVIRGDMTSAFGLTFTPDNKRLVVTSGGPRAVEIWDVETRQPLIVLSSPDGLLYHAGFSGDGNALLVGSSRSRTDGSGACQFWRAPSWEEIEEAERMGGLWTQNEASRLPKRPPSLADTKALLEAHYRKQITNSSGSSPEFVAARAEAQMQLANFLHQQERSADAEPLLRELRANLRQHGIEDDSVNSKLLEVVLALERVESGENSSRHVSKRRQKADAVVNELLDQMVRASARSNDTTLLFKVAVMLMWFGREEEHLLMCQRFMNEAAQKPNDPYVAAQAVRIFGVRRSADSALRDQALRLARQAAELEADRRRRGWCQQTVGIAEFRAGNWDAAEQMLLRAEEIAKDFASQDPKLQRYIEGPAGLFRAMILFHSGKQAEARKLFAQAVSQMPPLPEDDRQVLFNGSTTNDLLFWLTYREASALFQTTLGP